MNKRDSLIRVKLHGRHNLPSWVGFLGDLLDQSHLQHYWSTMGWHADVHVWPRSAMSPAWFARHYLNVECEDSDPRAQYPGRWGVRAWCCSVRRKIYLLVDDTETEASTLWLACHELGHLALARAPFTRFMLAVERDAIGQPHDYDQADDAEHERNPEEVLVNRWATGIVGSDYSRTWWRRRLEGRGIEWRPTAPVVSSCRPT